MADVGRRDRAQMIILTALLIAVVFVALALIVNSGIYTENLATRDSGGETRETLEQRAVVEEDLQLLVDKSNNETNTDDYDVVANTFEQNLAHWNLVQGQNANLAGRSYHTELISTREGTRIRQTDSDRNLTAGGSIAGQENWELADGVGATGEFEMVLERPSLLDATDETLDAVAREAYNVQIVNETGARWRVFMFRGALTGTAYLLVEEPGEDFENSTDGYTTFVNDACNATSGDIQLDFHAATDEPSWGTSNCPQLSFYNDDVLGGNSTYNITYRNTKTDGGTLTDPDDRANGTYSLVVDVRADRNPYYDAGSGKSPAARSIIHDATLHSEYRSKGLVLRNENISVTWGLIS